MNGTWRWQELAWDSPAAPAVGAAALERLATAVEVGPVVLELRAWAGGACWLVGCQPGRAVELEQLLGHHLPVRLHRPQRQRLAVGQAVRLQVRGSHVSTSASSTGRRPACAWDIPARPPRRTSCSPGCWGRCGSSRRPGPGSA